MGHSQLEGIMPFLIPILISISFIVLAGWLISVCVNALRHRMNVRTQTELHNRLLEKFDSASEFAAYLQTEAGQRFFDSLVSERITPMSKILGSIQNGTILTLLGAGLLLLGIIYRATDEGVFTIFGVIALALGAGFLISAGISYRLSKTWGLFDATGSAGHAPNVVIQP